MPSELDRCHDAPLMSDPVRLPILQQVEFRAFSLYSNHPTQTVPVHEGVFCLAGANGLGKSTFLNAAGFGLRGQAGRWPPTLAPCKSARLSALPDAGGSTTGRG